MNFDPVFFGVESEGDFVWENFKDVGDGEKAFTGNELGKKELLYTDQNLLSRIKKIHCSLCRRQQLTCWISGCDVRHIRRCCHR